MAHVVTCQYCGERFDRDKVTYVQLSARRYAHASCYLRLKEEENKKKLPQLEIIDPLRYVTCHYCKKSIDRKTEGDIVSLPNGKWAHGKCQEAEDTRERTPQEKLNDYIKKLFNMEYVPPRAQKQIAAWVTDYNYTYSGILKSLIYYYEVKGHPFDESVTAGGIGIVPYVYRDAYNYYYSIWEAKQKTQYLVDNDAIQQFIPKTVEIKIAEPKRVPVRRRELFSFLDEEEI